MSETAVGETAGSGAIVGGRAGDPVASPPRRNVARIQVVLFAIVVAYGLAAGVFFVLRPSGRWSENDTAVLSEASAGIARAERLVPQDGSVYPNGYGYQALSIFLTSFTDLSLAEFQQLLSPLLFAFVLLPVAWVTYRELAGGATAATLATLLLLVQPEFLFVVLRGSHEKLTRTLMLLALLLLVRSYRRGHDQRRFTVHVVLFYAAGYGIIACNNLLGSSFTAALALALVAGWALDRRVDLVRTEGGRDIRRRLLYNVICLQIIAFVFTFYVYPPAMHQFQLLDELPRKLGALFLETGPDRAVLNDPYVVISGGWVNLETYLVISLSNWLLLGASMCLWLQDGWRWLVRRQPPESAAAWLLWSLYGAFALQGAGAVLFDVLGAIATNLQHRAFASFVLIAAAVVARRVAPVLRAGFLATPWRQAALAAGMGALAVLSLLKASNDPIVSNKWRFYEPEEMQAMRWADSHMRDASLWTEFDERLTTAYLLVERATEPPAEREQRRNTLDAFQPKAATRDFLLTDVTRMRARRLQVPLPLADEHIRSYDNGLAQIYHLVPQTPYQR